MTKGGENNNDRCCSDSSCEHVDRRKRRRPQHCFGFSTISSRKLLVLSMLMVAIASTQIFATAAAAAEKSTAHEDDEIISSSLRNNNLERFTAATCATPYTDYKYGHEFKSGDKVSHDGKNYQCKPWPATFWCSSDSYVPGVSASWNMAWTMLEECKSTQQLIHEKGNKEDGVGRPAQQSKPLNEKIQDTDEYPPCPPEWKLNRVYSENDGVTSSSTNTIYKCKGYPSPGYCGQSPYEIERGQLYKTAWKEVGECLNDQMILKNEDEMVIHMYTATTTQIITPRPSPTLRATTGGNNSPIAKKVQEDSMATKFVLAKTPKKGKESSSSSSSKDIDKKSESLNDTICSDGLLYVCTIKSWCGLPDFKIKVGRYWELAWLVHGSCGREDGAGGGAGSNNVVSESSEAGNNKIKRCPNKTWVAGRSYSAGDKIAVAGSSSHTGQIYKCKGDPYSQWCGMTGYQPGVDFYWEMAWELKGDCTTRPVRPNKKPKPQSQNPPAANQSAGAIDRPTRPKPTPWPTPKREPATYVGATPPKPQNNPVNQPKPLTPKPTRRRTPRPVNPTPRPTPKKVNPTPRPTPKVDPTPPASSPSTSGSVEIGKAKGTTQQVYKILEQKKDRINSELFLYDTGLGGYEESTVYRYRGFKDGLVVMHEEGVGGSYFYLGDDSDIGYKIGLVNIAAFIAQSLKETVKYDVCDENSWDLVDSKYPLSNSCGQLGQSYQDYHCPEHEKHMECEVDPKMKITATTHAKWYGAPAPLFCAPKKDFPFTGFWDYTIHCDNQWANPPETCDVYEGQKGGGFDNSSPVANSAGRTDVEGCCWWGRGVIQTTGICNFGKLNFFLGARAAKEGRPSRYPEVDFCKTPDAICASEEHQELKWVAGYFYWINSLQAYTSGGWNYIDELHKFVENGMEGNSFIDAVSGIVNRGCHNPPCGTGPVDGGAERSSNFRKVLSVFLD